MACDASSMRQSFVVRRFWTNSTKTSTSYASDAIDSGKAQRSSQLDKFASLGRFPFACLPLATELAQPDEHEKALALEQLWNEIATRHEFSLVCAYPRRALSLTSELQSVVSVTNTSSSRRFDASTIRSPATTQE
jgi:hypothetical protein